MTTVIYESSLWAAAPLLAADLYFYTLFIIFLLNIFLMPPPGGHQLPAPHGGVMVSLWLRLCYGVMVSVMVSLKAMMTILDPLYLFVSLFVLYLFVFDLYSANFLLNFFCI